MVTFKVHCIEMFMRHNPCDLGLVTFIVHCIEMFMRQNPCDLGLGRGSRYGLDRP